MKIKNVMRIMCAGLLFGSALYGWAAEDISTKPIEKTGSTKEEEVTAVTVFGKLNDKKPGSQLRRIDPRRASNCNFSANRSAAEMEDEYLDFFYGKNHADPSPAPMANTLGVNSDQPGSGDGEQRNPAQEEKESFKDNAPGGTAEANVKIAEGCSRSDYNAAAGRNWILRKDKTLTDAFTAYDAENYPLALEVFKKSWDKIGYDEAGLMLGDMYFLGQGTKVDVPQAISWYTKVAEARFSKDQLSPFDPAHPDEASARAQSQVKLARIYLLGVGVDKSPKQARKWYEAASDLGYVPAKYRLAQFYLRAVGGDKNPKAAIKLLKDASESGYAAAQYALADWYFVQEDTPENAKASFEWYQQAAFNPYPDNKKPYAQFALAESYERGSGVAADSQKAFAFYKLAAIAGHADAQNALGTYFYSGELGTKDLTIARRLFESAASQQQVDAMFNLGLMLIKGEGGGVDKVKAYIWLTLAAKLGNDKALAVAAKLERQLTPQEKAKASELLRP